MTVHSLPRYSVSVFQPPFQLGRMSPEQGLQPLLLDKLEPLAKGSCAAATSAPELGDGDRASGLLQEPPLSPAVPELYPEMSDTGTVRSKVLAARSSLLSLDSGFSEHMDLQGDSCCEKEPSYERALKPEGRRCCSAITLSVPGAQAAPRQGREQFSLLGITSHHGICFPHAGWSGDPSGYTGSSGSRVSEVQLHLKCLTAHALPCPGRARTAEQSSDLGRVWAVGGVGRQGLAEASSPVGGQSPALSPSGLRAQCFPRSDSAAREQPLALGRPAVTFPDTCLRMAAMCSEGARQAEERGLPGAGVC